MKVMISIDKVKQMQQQMSDLVELTGELQKELIHNVSLRRDGLLLQQSAIQEDKNLGVLLRPNEGLQVTVAAINRLRSAFPLLPPLPQRHTRTVLGQLSCFSHGCVGRRSQRMGVCKLFWSDGWPVR
jgi:hypothetical protein